MTRGDDEVPGRLEIALLAAVAVLTVAVLVVLLSRVVLHHSEGLGGSGDEVTIRCESVVGAAFPWSEPETAKLDGSVVDERDQMQACADHRTGRLGVALLLAMLTGGLLVWQTQLRTWRLSGRQRR